MSKNINAGRMYPTYFAAGALILYTLLYVLPALYGFYMSFTDWNQIRDISTLQFVGLENFKTVFSPEKEYFKYIGNTFSFAFFTSLAKSLIAFFAALAINKGIKHRNLHRAALFFPSIISVVVTGLIFRSILRPDKGLVNMIIKLFGGIGGTDFLNNVATAFPSAMAVDVWRVIGYIMIIYLAGLQSISPTYYEAADIDGVGSFAKIRYITVPLLKQTILINLMLNLIYGFRVFDMIYVLTRGGPGHLTEVLYTSVFREFGRGNYAIGSALSSVMLVFMLIGGSFYIRLITKQEVEQ